MAKTAQQAAKEINDHIKSVAKPSPITPAEALYSFVGWLSSRDEIVILSAKHSPGRAVQLIEQWLKTNDLPRPEGMDWPEKMKLPTT